MLPSSFRHYGGSWRTYTELLEVQIQMHLGVCQPAFCEYPQPLQWLRQLRHVSQNDGYEWVILVHSDRASVGSIADAYVSTSSWQIIVAPLTPKSVLGSFPLSAAQRFVNRTSNDDASSSKLAPAFLCRRRLFAADQ